MSSILGPTVAGSWYPAEAGALRRQLSGFLDDGPTTDVAAARRIGAMIVPHAGYVYSGRVAARGLSLLAGLALDRVMLLGPSHFVPLSGAALPEASTYRTPLGDVALDTAAIRGLADKTDVRIDDAPFRREHCLDAVIPFLQHYLEPGWRLLPMLVGMLDGSGGEQIAERLRPLRDDGTLVVVSSDFTHYGKSFDYLPFDDDVPRRIEELDREAIDLILAWDPAGLDAFFDRSGATVCGRNPIRVLLRMIPGGLDGRLAAYDTSGRMTDRWDHSVSYASLVFSEPGGAGDSP